MLGDTNFDDILSIIISQEGILTALQYKAAILQAMREIIPISLRKYAIYNNFYLN